MLKALVKKQFKEMFRSYFVNQRTGKAVSHKKRIGLGILYVFLLMFLFGIFFVVGVGVGPFLFEVNLDWLFFALMGIISIALGVFGSVFNTYAGMYLAKDNDLLISMPIPPATILLSRVFTVIGMAFLYSAIPWIPGLIVYWIWGHPTVTNIIFGILLAILISMFVAVVTCVLGWLVALIASRLKRKNIATVVLSVVFFVVYYAVCFRMESLIEGFIHNSAVVGEAVEKWGNLFYQIGQAATGNVKAFLIFTAITLVMCLISYKVLSITFVKIATRNVGTKKTVYKRADSKQISIDKALYRKEMKRFTGSATYMLNAGIGLALLPIAAIFILVKSSDIMAMIEQMKMQIPEIDTMIILVVILLIGALTSMNQISTPSISLEGKNIWILQTLPIDCAKVMKAKLQLHFNLNLISVAISVVCITLALDLDSASEWLILGYSAVFIWFIGIVGLFFGVKRVNLNWTNETVPVKQSLNILFVMVAGLIVLVGTAVGGYFLSDFVDMKVYIGGCALVIALVSFLIHRWVFTKGAELFAKL